MDAIPTDAIVLSAVPISPDREILLMPCMQMKLLTENSTAQTMDMMSQWLCLII